LSTAAAHAEILAAKAAQASGVRFCLSTMSICTIEDIAEATTQPFWFQLYVFKDRAFSETVIARAKALDIIRNELDISVILTGTKVLAKVSREVLYDAAPARAYPRN
jgi:L-lactate dehydrogenase (cytochrome)